MPICSVEGCTRLVRAKGLCKTHYQRIREYGRFDKVMTGEKTKHPLYGMWNRRRQIKNSFVSEWLNFDTFLTAVGDKPDNHFLARLNEDEPCGPNNFEWRKIKVQKLEGETDKEYRLRQQAQYRLDYPLAARKSNYKINFNLTLEEVEKKLKNQNYVCAICKQPETATYKDTGKLKTLALDHNHKTKQIRDLLCSKCNLFVGKVEKDRELISKIEKYLDRWQVQQDNL